MNLSLIFFLPSFHPSWKKTVKGDGISWRASRWLKQRAYLSNLHKDIHIKAQIKTHAHSMDFYQSIHFLFFFFPAPFFSFCHIPLSLSIFRALLGHDKSKRDVMTQDPLLALGGGRENERENGEGKEGGRWKRFVWKWLLTRHWFSALISHSVLKFPIREMKKRSEREMGLIHRWGGETWHVSQRFFGPTKHTFPLFWKEKQCPEGFFSFFFFLHVLPCC